jgi:hypothetical protein
VKNPLTAWLYSSRVLTVDVAKRQIEILAQFGDGVFRPDQFGDSEKLVSVFNERDVGDAVDLLSASQGAFCFRSRRLRKLEGQIWNLYFEPTMLKDLDGTSVPSHSAPFFCTRWTLDFERKWARDKPHFSEIILFLKKVFIEAGADFGFFTERVDLEEKNFLGGVERVGTDPFEALPGLYWTNFFSKRYADWLGIGKLAPDEVISIQEEESLFVVQFGPEILASRSRAVLESQATIIQTMGFNRFFDIHDRNRQCEAAPWHTMGRT